MLASFPGSFHAQAKNFRTASDGKLGGAWEQGYYNVVTRTHIPSPSSLGTKAVICKLVDYIAHIHTFSLLPGDRKALQGLCDMWPELGEGCEQLWTKVTRHRCQSGLSTTTLVLQGLGAKRTQTSSLITLLLFLLEMLVSATASTHVP